MDVQQETEVAMAKAIREQMSQQTARALKQALREEMLDELREEAVALAKVELEEEFSRRRERLADDLAQTKAQLEDEMLGELDRISAKLRGEVQDEMTETLLTLQDDRDQARAERDRAEGLLVAVIQQLLPGEKPVYLQSTGIREVDRWQLNQTLQRYHLQVRSKTTYSARVVKVRLDQERYASHTVFWLTPVPVAGVEDAADGDPAEGGATV